MNYSAENNLPLFRQINHLNTLAKTLGANRGKPGSPVPTTPAISNLKVVAASLPSSFLSKLFPKKLNETPSEIADSNPPPTGKGNNVAGFASAIKASTANPDTISPNLIAKIVDEKQEPIKTQPINNFPKNPLENLNFGGA